MEKLTNFLMKHRYWKCSLDLKLIFTTRWFVGILTIVKVINPLSKTFDESYDMYSQLRIQLIHHQWCSHRLDRRLVLRDLHFSKISRFIERVLMEHIDQIRSRESKLLFESTCFIQVCSRKRDIHEKWESPLSAHKKKNSLNWCVHNRMKHSPYRIGRRLPSYR